MTGSVKTKRKAESMPEAEKVRINAPMTGYCNKATLKMKNLAFT